MGNLIYFLAKLNDHEGSQTHDFRNTQRQCQVDSSNATFGILP